MGNVNSYDEEEANTSKIPNGRGGNIFCRFYRSEEKEDPPSSIVFYFHGLFLHSGVEAEKGLCNYISEAIDSYVVAFDLTGHGRSASDTDRGHLGDWQWFVDDTMSVIKDTIQNTQKIWSSLPFFLFGLSLGGCVALNVSLRLQDKIFENFAGTLLIAPAIYDNIRPEEWIVDTLRWVNNFGGGYLALGPAAELNHFGNTEDFEAFKNDKYCYSGRLRLSMGHGLLTMTEETQKLIKNVKFPFCLIHSTDDSIVLVRGSRELYEFSQTPLKDKVYYEYDNLGHNVLNAPCALDKCFTWIKRIVTKYQFEEENYEDYGLEDSVIKNTEF